MRTMMQVWRVRKGGKEGVREGLFIEMLLKVM